MFLLAFAEQSIQLFPDGTIFFHIALILLMIWILNRTLFRPINKIIEAREKNKGGASSEAEMILGQVSEKESAYKKELLAARSEGYEIVEKIRSEAVQNRQTRVTRAKEEISGLMTEEKASIVEQEMAARQSIAADAEKIAERISTNILKA